MKLFINLNDKMNFFELSFVLFEQVNSGRLINITYMYSASWVNQFEIKDTCD